MKWWRINQFRIFGFCFLFFFKHHHRVIVRLILPFNPSSLTQSQFSKALSSSHSFCRHVAGVMGQTLLSMTITLTDDYKEGVGLLITRKQAAKWKRNGTSVGDGPRRCHTIDYCWSKGLMPLGNKRSQQSGEKLGDFLLQKSCMQVDSWGVRFPTVLSLLVWLFLHEWMPLYENQMIKSILIFSNWRFTLTSKRKCITRLGEKRIKPDIMKNTIVENKQKLLLTLIHQSIFSYLLNLIERSTVFPWIVSLPVNMCAVTRPLRKKEHCLSLFSVSLTTTFVCCPVMTLSDRGSPEDLSGLRLWRPQTDRYMKKNKAARKPHNASLKPPMTSVKARFLQWPTNVTSNGWHILMADAYRKTMFL